MKGDMRAWLGSSGRNTAAACWYNPYFPIRGKKQTSVQFRETHPITIQIVSHFIRIGDALGFFNDDVSLLAPAWIQPEWVSGVSSVSSLQTASSVCLPSTGFPSCYYEKSDFGSSGVFTGLLEWILPISSSALASESRSLLSWCCASHRFRITAEGLCCLAK